MMYLIIKSDDKDKLTAEKIMNEVREFSKLDGIHHHHSFDEDLFGYNDVKLYSKYNDYSGRGLNPSSRYESDRYFDKYIDKYGYHFNEKLAEYASSMMNNRNNSRHRWTCKEIKPLLSSSDYGKCTLGDITYLANMAYADFYPRVLQSEDACVKYAIAVAHDVDGYDSIAFSRWLADVKAKRTYISWEDYV